MKRTLKMAAVFSIMIAGSLIFLYYAVNKNNPPDAEPQLTINIINRSSSEINASISINGFNTTIQIQPQKTETVSKRLNKGYYDISIHIDQTRTINEKIQVYDVPTTWSYLVYDDRIEKPLPPPIGH